MGHELEVQPADLNKAAKDYEAQANRAKDNRTGFEGGAKLDPDVWGNLPESYKMANNYDDFYTRVLKDMEDISKSLTKFADVLKGAAKAYEQAEHDNTITVKPGDTLSGIAKNKLGDGSRWPEIAANNPHINDPDLIYPGDKIKIPVSHHDGPSGSGGHSGGPGGE